MNDIETKIKERLEFYLKDLQRCDEEGHHGTSLHYRAIIDELNLISGHKHDWIKYKHISLCNTCRKIEIEYDIHNERKTR